jgi:hypothetical protein
MYRHRGGYAIGFDGDCAVGLIPHIDTFDGLSTGVTIGMVVHPAAALSTPSTTPSSAHTQPSPSKSASHAVETGEGLDDHRGGGDVGGNGEGSGAGSEGYETLFARHGSFARCSFYTTHFALDGGPI